VLRQSLAFPWIELPKKGTILYRLGGLTVGGDGKLLKISQSANDKGLESILEMAVERFGETLTLNGTSEFKDRVIRIAASAKLKLNFSDPDLEKRRLALMSAEDASDTGASKYVEERNGKESETFLNTGTFSLKMPVNSYFAGRVQLTGSRLHSSRRISRFWCFQSIGKLPHCSIGF